MVKKLLLTIFVVMHFIIPSHQSIETIRSDYADYDCIISSRRSITHQMKQASSNTIVPYQHQITTRKNVIKRCSPTKLGTNDIEEVLLFPIVISIMSILSCPSYDNELGENGRIQLINLIFEVLQPIPKECIPWSYGYGKSNSNKGIKEIQMSSFLLLLLIATSSNESGSRRRENSLPTSSSSYNFGHLKEEMQFFLTKSTANYFFSLVHDEIVSLLNDKFNFQLKSIQRKSIKVYQFDYELINLLYEFNQEKHQQEWNNSTKELISKLWNNYVEFTGSSGSRIETTVYHLSKFFQFKYLQMMKGVEREVNTLSNGTVPLLESQIESIGEKIKKATELMTIHYLPSPSSFPLFSKRDERWYEEIVEMFELISKQNSLGKELLGCVEKFKWFFEFQFNLFILHLLTQFKGEYLANRKEMLTESEETVLKSQMIRKRLAKLLIDEKKEEQKKDKKEVGIIHSTESLLSTSNSCTESASNPSINSSLPQPVKQSIPHENMIDSLLRSTNRILSIIDPSIIYSFDEPLLEQEPETTSPNQLNSNSFETAIIIYQLLFNNPSLPQSTLWSINYHEEQIKTDLRIKEWNPIINNKVTFFQLLSHLNSILTLIEQKNNLNNFCFTNGSFNDSHLTRTIREIFYQVGNEVGTELLKVIFEYFNLVAIQLTN